MNPEYNFELNLIEQRFNKTRVMTKILAIPLILFGVMDAVYGGYGLLFWIRVICEIWGGVALIQRKKNAFIPIQIACSLMILGCALFFAGYIFVNNVSDDQLVWQPSMETLSILGIHLGILIYLASGKRCELACLSPTLLPDLVKKNKIQELEFALEKGMDPNELRYVFWAPLTLAVKKGYGEAAKVLLKYGANPNLKSGWRINPKSAREIASQFGRLDMLSPEKQAQA